MIPHVATLEFENEEAAITGKRVRELGEESRPPLMLRLR